MTKSFTLAFLLLAVFYTQAQSSIKGKIKDVNGKSISSATVSLFKSKDSALVSLSISGKEGEFDFINLKEGNYFIIITSVGFNKYKSVTLEVKEGTLVIPDIVLLVISKDLATVLVEARKPFIETKIDKTIVNVDASPTNAGSTALEILEKSPGITVDDNGNISLRGKAGVIVMMDGKQTYLSAADLANMLKNMPAAALDQIEIMTNPSSKYDASGNSGVINIKTKKGKNNGFNGSIMAGFSSSIYTYEGSTVLIPKSQNSLTFNYRKNKINLFGNYSPNVFNGRNTLVINRKFVDGTGNTIGYSDQLTKFKFGNVNQTFKIGIDLIADKKNVYGFVASGFVFNGHPKPSTTSELKDPNGTVTSQMISLTENKINFSNYAGNFNWKHNFDSTGNELTADFDYIHYNNISDLLLSTNFYDATGYVTSPPLYLKGYLPSSINIYSFKSDYVKSFQNGKVEAGIKTSFVKNDNLVDYSRQLTDKSWATDARSNHFVYKENINAAYVNVNKQLKKWSVQAGLRVENTIAEGYQVTNDSTFKRNFTNLFPSLFLSYAVNKNNQLTLSYSRRVNRPNYQDLNPFTYFLDSLTYRVGNPYLLPQFSQNFELSYALKNKYILALNYSNTTDVISQVLKQNTEKRITYNTSENIARFQNMGLSLTIPVTVSKWWAFNFFTNIYNNHYNGIYNTTPIDISFTSFMTNITNSFTISKGFTAELSGFYRYRSVDQLAVLNPFGNIAIGLQKQIMQGKGTVRINVRDPFAWQKFSGYTKYDDIDFHFSNKPDIRQATFTFTYRFGKTNLPGQQSKHNGAAQDEQNRVGQGN